MIDSEGKLKLCNFSINFVKQYCMVLKLMVTVQLKMCVVPSVSTSSQQTGVVMCPVLCYTCGKLNLSHQMQFLSCFKALLLHQL